MHHSANTYITVSGFGTGGFGTGRFGGGPNITLKEGGRDVLLDDVAKRVFVFWETLTDELYPPPPPIEHTSVGQLVAIGP